MTRRLDSAVRQILGDGAALRDAQRDALTELEHRDTVLVARSGAGKTAVFAIATLLAERLTVVVSPTLSLQHDHVGSLGEVGLRARALNSDVGVRARRQALEASSAGELDVLLLAPEQLVRPEVADALGAADVGLVVIDEAHCVSEWGHDFRPDYLHIAAALRRTGRAGKGPRVLAMTATASASVRADIVDRLGLEDPAVVVHDVDRPNIWLAARDAATDADRDSVVVEEALRLEGAGIVYAPTRARTEELAVLLADAGRPALVYHGGLRGADRREAQDTFMRGDSDLVVATSAFGMGVDRADVRFVLHAGPSTSLDAYYQEVGRAGRDGEPAVAILVHRTEDFALGRYLRSGPGQRPATLRSVARRVRAGDTSRSGLAEATGLSARSVSRALGALVQVSAVEELPDGRLTWTSDSGVDAVLTQVAKRREQQQRIDLSRVEMMRTYADTLDCRRRVLLELLGEPQSEPCGRCDSCERGTSKDAADAAFRLAERVEHPEWGSGAVTLVEEDRITVMFDEHGYKTLSSALVQGSDLLVRAGGRG